MLTSSAAPAAFARTVVVYSEQDPVLANNQKARHFKSNMWVEEADAWWTSKLTGLKPAEKPTVTTIDRRLELLNGDQFQNVPATMKAAVTQHSSGKTGKAYGTKMSQQLEEHAQKERFVSKWWISPQEARKRGWQLKDRQRPVTMMMRVESKVFNAEQFAEPVKLTEVCFSGGSKKPFGEELAQKLRKHMHEHKFHSGLYFSQKQLDAMGLATTSTAQGCPVSSGTALKLFNAADLIGAEGIMEQLQRYPTAEPAYLLSGRLLGAEWKAEALKMKAATNYWISKREMDREKYQIKADAKAIVYPGSYEVLMYNVEQLHNKAEGFRLAGTLLQ